MRLSVLTQYVASLIRCVTYNHCTKHVVLTYLSVFEEVHWKSCPRRRHCRSHFRWRYTRYWGRRNSLPSQLSCSCGRCTCLYRLLRRAAHCRRGKCPRHCTCQRFLDIN